MNKCKTDGASFFPENRTRLFCPACGEHSFSEPNVFVVGGCMCLGPIKASRAVLHSTIYFERHGHRCS